MRGYKKYNRRSQMQSQMFIYLLTIMIIGFLLFLGFKWIGSLMKTTDIISLTKLKYEMQNTFDTYRTRYGSWKIASFKIPESVTRVCFADLSLKRTAIEHSAICTPGNRDYNIFVCDAWKDKTQNVFFIPFGSVRTVIKIGEIAVPKSNHNGYICFDVVSSEIKLKLKGLGNKVEVSAPGTA